MAKCHTTLLLADALTKPLGRLLFLIMKYRLLGGARPSDCIRQLILPCGTEISTGNLINLEEQVTKDFNQR